MKQKRTYFNYAQFYDENKRELCGSENFIRCDGRKSIETLVSEFRHKALSQIKAHERDPKLYCANFWHYVQIKRGQYPSRASNISEIMPLFT